MRGRILAVIVSLGGCMAAPPPSADDGPDAGDRDDGDGDDGHPDGGQGDACAAGSALDLAWVSEVAFDFAAQDQVSLRGLAVIVNPGADPLELDDFSAVSASAGGGVTGSFSVVGGDLAIAPGRARGAVATDAAVPLLEVVSEEWDDLATPELKGVLTFAVDSGAVELPLELHFGGYRFDVSIRVVHDPAFTGFRWARDARRTTAHCE